MGRAIKGTHLRLSANTVHERALAFMRFRKSESDKCKENVDEFHGEGLQLVIRQRNKLSMGSTRSMTKSWIGIGPT